MYSEKNASYEKMFSHGDIPWRIFRQLPPAIRGPFAIAPHYSYSVEFVLTESIIGEAFISGRKSELCEKSVFFIPPSVVHSFNYVGGNGKILAMKLNLNSLSRYINLEQIFNLGSLRADNADHDEIKADVMLLKKDIPLPEKLMSVMRIFSRLKPMDEPSSGTRTAYPRLTAEEQRTITDWTDKNLDKQINLADVAALLGYNRTYFCAKFKETKHMTYLSYLNSVRMTRACTLLTRGLTIGSVARECGFVNESYFIKLFSKMIGFTPGRYREIAANSFTVEKSGEELSPPVF